MITIYVRKILKYDPTFGGEYSKYEGYKKITLQQLDPHIDIYQRYKLSIPQNITLPIMTSKLNRSVETANRYFKKKDISAVSELQEIKFDLSSLLTEAEYNECGSSLVRTKFIEAFSKDTLRETRREIKQRIESLMEKFKEQEDGSYLVISHSFFMKIFESYIINPTIFKKPYLLKKYISAGHKTYEYGHGFDFTINRDKDYGATSFQIGLLKVRAGG